MQWVKRPENAGDMTADNEAPSTQLQRIETEWKEIVRSPVRWVQAPVHHCCPNPKGLQIIRLGHGGWN